MVVTCYTILMYVTRNDQTSNYSEQNDQTVLVHTGQYTMTLKDTQKMNIHIFDSTTYINNGFCYTSYLHTIVTHTHSSHALTRTHTITRTHTHNHTHSHTHTHTHSHTHTHTLIHTHTHSHALTHTHSHTHTHTLTHTHTHTSS